MYIFLWPNLIPHAEYFIPRDIFRRLRHALRDLEAVWDVHHSYQLVDERFLICLKGDCKKATLAGASGKKRM